MTKEYDKPPNTEFPHLESSQALKERLIRLSTEFHTLLTEMAQDNGPMASSPVHLFVAIETLQRALGKDPERAAKAQQNLINRLGETAKLINDNEQANAEETTDKSESNRIHNPRFADPLWCQFPLFDFISQSYMVLYDWTRELVEDTEHLSEQERKEVQFQLHQFLSALSPSNNFFTNPVAIKRFIDTDGASLEAGLENLKRDYDADFGHLNISQCDKTAFEIGKNVAATKGQVVFKNELIELIRFSPSTKSVFERPLLIFPPWINKYYVLDLQAKNSLVAWLRDQGFTVYMISWRSADHITRDLDWDNYASLGGLAAIKFVYETHNISINIAGYCIGGTMLSTLAAYLAKKKDPRINSLTFMAAQTNFEDAGMMKAIVSERTFSETAAAIVKNKGIMPGELMSDGFNSLRPQRLIWQFIEENYLLGEDVKPFDLLYWNSDQTNIPGPLHLEYIQNFYIENQLAKNEFFLFDEKISLNDINWPVFIHAAFGDHISPFESVYSGRHLFGGDTKFILAEAGHIAGVVNPPTNNKYGHWSRGNPKLQTGADWKDSASYKKQSWWPALAEWLSERSGDLVSPPPPIKNAPSAPGVYVKTTLADIHQMRN
ncbi:PHA/PHB synthase family protein [Hirschia litorea]|uniref:PHA/PHB synthase family protein n=1 Tax=Hirschia litorea TaxID=1199156 RepID=A0ABW2IIJ4_9PROT